MLNKLKIGDVVKVVHCNRSKFMNNEFCNWIDRHKNYKFKIANIVDGSIKLYKVGFWISIEFIEKLF